MSLAGPGLMLCVKAPWPGRCKTRLAEAYGSDVAAEFAVAFMDDLSANVRAWPGEHVLVCEDVAHPLLARLVGPGGWTHLPLPRAPLGELLGAAFQQCFEAGLRPVLAVGGDLPDLTAVDLLVAMECLGRRDVVLGPSADGGYYLIGLNGWLPEAFTGIPWSTPETLAVTLARLRHAGRTVELLPVRRDIDEPGDLQVLLRDLPRIRLCPRTAEAARKAGVAVL